MSWCNQLLPLKVYQTPAFPNFVLENAHLAIQRVLCLVQRYTHAFQQILVGSIPHCLVARFGAKRELLPCPST